MGSDNHPTLSARVLKAVKKRVPILGWMPLYGKGDLIADLIAGITVGLTVVPQSMAYAAIAGLTPEYGLYASYIGCLIYVVLGTCRQATIGPTAVISLATFQTCGESYPSCAVLTGFYAGVIELLMALLQLGWVVSFISEPVTIGYTAGASLTIISSQIKSFFGITGPSGDGFTGYWENIFEDFNSIKWADSVMGVSCFIALLGLRHLGTIQVKKESRALKKALMLISVSRNVIIVVLTTVIATIWSSPPFRIVGTVHGGFPEIGPPAFLLPNNANGTGEDPDDQLSFSETWSVLGSGPAVIALLSVLQNVAISKSFGAGQSVDATQEMFALGTCNVVGGFFGAFPISGAFSRSAVNEASGVRSPLGGLFTGIIVLFALNFLSSSFYYIPKASLAAVLISAVMYMIDYGALVPMWKISKVDVLACLVTFLVSCALGMEYGILVGVAISLGFFLMHALKPKIQEDLLLEERTGTKYFFITPETGLMFPSVDFVRTRLNKLVLKFPGTAYYFLNFEKWTRQDYTGATSLVSLLKGFKKNGKVLQFTNCSAEWARALADAGLINVPLIEVIDIGDFLVKQECGTKEVEDPVIKIDSASARVAYTPSLERADLEQ